MILPGVAGLGSPGIAEGSNPVLLPTVGNMPVLESNPVERDGIAGAASAPVDIPVCCPLGIDCKVPVCHLGSNNPLEESPLVKEEPEANVLTGVD